MLYFFLYLFFRELLGCLQHILLRYLGKIIFYMTCSNKYLP
jgi:hypothetical protein